MNQVATSFVCVCVTLAFADPGFGGRAVSKRGESVSGGSPSQTVEGGGCQSDAECDDSVPCTVDVCMSSGLCINVTDDGECDDGVTCTIDICDTTGCIFVPDDNACTDNNICTGIDTCDPVMGCVSSLPIDCDDGIDCTDDICNPTTGDCINASFDSRCDDGVQCTIDFCSDTGCVSFPDNVFCDDDNDCNGLESCDPQLGCVAGTPIECDDGIDCTEDSCNSFNGSCINVSLDSLCDDGIGCTIDFCTDAGCSNFPDSASCDDGDDCNGLEVCNPTVGCQSSSPIVCDDGIDCTEDSCNPLNGSCTFIEVDSNCDDGIGCTIDFCTDAGCSNFPDSAFCDDGLFCNGVEFCMDGGCGPGLYPCGNLVCIEDTDECVPCANDAQCDDGNPCTVDTCVQGECRRDGIPGCEERCASASKKGSLLVFPAIELKWNGNGNLIQDTIISITNDYVEDVHVHHLFVNGDDGLPAQFCCDPPTIVERAHDGWTRHNWTALWTANEPNFYTLSTGLPKGAPPFVGLDNGPEGPGRPDPENAGQRVLRGYLFAWAVDATGNQISWNHLSGTATTVHYADLSAWEYEGVAFRARDINTGQVVGQEAGVLRLDGEEYELSFNRLLLDFFGVGATPLASAPVSMTIATDVTLLPMTQDLRQHNTGPVVTKAKFDVWNQNEDFLSHSDHCLSCWDQVLLENISLPNHFLLASLQTNKGKARIDGEESSVCDQANCCDRTNDACHQAWEKEYLTRTPNCSEATSLVGVATKLIRFDGGAATARAGTVLVGQGKQEGLIYSDLSSVPEPATPSGE